MDFGYWTSLLWFLLLWITAQSALVPDGVYRTECRDRYFMIAVDLSFTGQEPFFEALDETGVFPITEEYAAQCGYTVSVFTSTVELRASYFSCHTANQNDQNFTFNFNLVTTRVDQNGSYALNETCSPALPWSPREVTCEVNYLEVSMQNNVICPLSQKSETWDISMQMVYRAATPDWQIVLVKKGSKMKPLKLGEGGLNGYSFTATDNRLVFRAAYGQPHSSKTVIGGISVEVVHAILFSRQEWMVLLVDLIASCTVAEAPQEDGYMTWETPFRLNPGLDTTSFRFGLNGELWEPTVAQDMGYSLINDSSTIKMGIPYNAHGAYRKSVVAGDLFDLYTCHFYMEQMATSKGEVETRTRTFRKLSSPPFKRLLLTENRTVSNEEMFTVYLGNVPGDLELVAVHLNKEEFQAPFVNSTSYTLDITEFPNNTYSYTLKVPFDNSFIIKRFSEEYVATENELNIAYTVMIRPWSELHSYHTTVTALSGISPPHFDAFCSESGITFTLDHEPSDFLWDVIVSSKPLTSELAVQQGFIMRNNSRTLQLEVPLFTHGYKYERITLDGFLGTFETYIRNRKTSEVLRSSVKTCPFTADEIVVCSKDGKMTVVADLSEVVASGGNPIETSLLDEYCAPVETDATRALFSFSLNHCGTKVKLDNLSVIYTNEILFILNDTAEIGRIRVECTYPLVALHPLFSTFTFESKTVGVGRIVHPLPSALPGTDLQSSTVIPTTTEASTTMTPTTTKPATTIPTTTKPTRKPITKPTRKPITKPATSTGQTVVQAHKPPVRYIKVLSSSGDIRNRGQFSNTF